MLTVQESHAPQFNVIKVFDNVYYNIAIQYCNYLQMRAKMGIPYGFGIKKKKKENLNFTII